MGLINSILELALLLVVMFMAIYALDLIIKLLEPTYDKLINTTKK